jgi:hypothetical protein
MNTDASESHAPLPPPEAEVWSTVAGGLAVIVAVVSAWTLWWRGECRRHPSARQDAWPARPFVRDGQPRSAVC